VTKTSCRVRVYSIFSRYGILRRFITRQCQQRHLHRMVYEVCHCQCHLEEETSLRLRVLINHLHITKTSCELGICDLRRSTGTWMTSLCQVESHVLQGTRGECLSGYLGESGHANSECVSLSTLPFHRSGNA
jgi:hypothetical protein